MEKLLANKRSPVVLETQDIQADQYRLRNEGAFLLPPRATYDEMLAIELDWMRRADLMVHLNAEEDATFRRLLPEEPHALIYPAVAPVPTGPGADDIIMVASANRGNVLSVEWFLSEILPRAGDVKVAIIGNVDAAGLANVTLAETAESFAAVLRAAAAKPPLGEAQRRASETRRFYEAYFSLEAYREALSSRVLPLLSAR